MKTPRLLRRVLVGLYPRAWREQYGSELDSLLDAHPLTAAASFDVVRSAAWQRLRATSPATVLGTGVMLLVVGGVALTPTAYGSTGTALIQPSNRTLPTITVTFLASEYFALLLVVCGAWTQARYGRGAAKAAMWMTILAGLPVTALGVLMLVGLVDGYSAVGVPPQAHAHLPWALIIAPAMRSLESAIWGSVGGRIGRRLGEARSVGAQ